MLKRSLRERKGDTPIFCFESIECESLRGSAHLGAAKLNLALSSEPVCLLGNVVDMLEQLR